MFASGETKTFYPLVKTINDTFISFAFLSLVVLALLLPSFEPYLLYFPLILLLLSARGDREQASILDRIVSRVHYLIVPFVFTCLIRFVKELNEKVTNMESALKPIDMPPMGMMPPMPMLRVISTAL